MALFDTIRMGASGAEDSYEIERSLRFNRDDTNYLSRTPSSAGNRDTWTLSCWVKKGEVELYQAILYAGPSTGANHNNTDAFAFSQNDQLFFGGEVGQSVTYSFTTNRKFRDVSAWYHIVLAVDTTQGTASNRVKLYINGVQETSFATETYMSQNQDTFVNATNIHAIGYTSNTRCLDGYMAEYYLIDGQQLTPASFGETNAATGQWNPIEYTGTFGTNGFYLKFADNSSTSALGTDSSGNNHTWTTHNFGVSNHPDNDSMFDSPTNNFPTMNIFDRSSGPTITNGNLQFYYNYKPASKTVRMTSALPASGKYYWEWHNEVDTSGRWGVGLVRYASEGQTYDVQGYNDVDYVNMSFGGSLWFGTTHVSGSWSSTPTFYSSVRMAFAIDCSNGKLWIGQVASNGTTTWYDDDGTTDGDPAGGSNETGTLPNFTTATEWMPVIIWHDGGSADSTVYTCNINFGNKSFLGTIPNGFTTLGSKNLPNPTILLPNKHFEALLYTTSGSTLNITGLQFDPDFAWLKNRSIAYSPEVYDTVRGDGKRIFPDSGNVENTSGALSFGVTGGYSIVNSASINDSGVDNIATWNWNAGDTDGKTYTVTVVDDSGNKYRFDGFGTSAVTLDLVEGGTYIFNYPSAHPLKFSTTADGTHGGGSEYTTGVTHNSSTQVTIVVAASAPTLYYYCSSHSGMGGQVNTNSTLGSSNFDGSIQSTAKVNASAGFSIVSYTGTGADATIGHGLGVTPSAIILKDRDRSVDWVVKHKSATSGYILYLNLTGAADGATGGNNGIIADLSSSSNFSITRTSNSGNYNLVGVNGEDYIAYCFSSVEGYSKFGSYTGNGNANGTFIYTGFRPAFVMTKGTWGGNWNIYDNKRPAINVTNDILYPNLNNVEYDGSSTDNQMDLLSNGFKLRGSDVDTNGNGSTYIYFAFAESPFKNARAR